MKTFVEPKRVTVVTGHFGSGKTEFAINYAVKLKNMGKKVTIVDFDIVNPYFRTKDAENALNSLGIDVISPAFANLNIENPMLPPDINRVFDDKESYVVFDVGGDDDGAVPLGTYYRFFKDEDYDMFFIINERRLLTQTVEDIFCVMDSIESVSRLKVTALVNNTHLKELTTPEIICKGQELVEEYSEKTGLEQRYISGKEEILYKLPDKYKKYLYPMKLYINLMF